MFVEGRPGPCPASPPGRLARTGHGPGRHDLRRRRPGRGRADLQRHPMRADRAHVPRGRRARRRAPRSRWTCGPGATGGPTLLCRPRRRVPDLPPGRLLPGQPRPPVRGPVGPSVRRGRLLPRAEHAPLPSGRGRRDHGHDRAPRRGHRSLGRRTLRPESATGHTRLGWGHTGPRAGADPGVRRHRRRGDAHWTARRT